MLDGHHGFRNVLGIRLLTFALYPPTAQSWLYEAPDSYKIILPREGTNKASATYAHHASDFRHGLAFLACLSPHAGSNMN